MTPSQVSARDAATALEEVASLRVRAIDSIAPIIVGQREVLDDILIAILSGGHCLIEGVPGLAKTLIVKSLAQTLALDFGRIQFTPDLMPADIIGTEVLEEDRENGFRRLRFLQGPIFRRSLSAVIATDCRSLFLYWPPGILSSKKAPIHSPRASSIASC